jgi:hypothetical protein
MGAQAPFFLAKIVNRSFSMDTPSPFPLVNLNGTSADALLADRRKVWNAIRDTMKALQECAPHGRDYQTAPRGAYEAARERYSAQFAVLDKLSNEIMDECKFIQDQKKK